MIKAPHFNLPKEEPESDDRREKLLRRARMIAAEFDERVRKLLGQNSDEPETSDQEGKCRMEDEGGHE